MYIIVKKIIFLIIIFILSISFIISCALQDDNGSTNQDDELQSLPEGVIDDGGLYWDTNEKLYILEEEIVSGAVPLKLWLDNEPFANAIIEGFNRIYPNVRIEVQSFLPQDSIDRMVLEGEAGTGADVFLIPHDLVGRAHSNSVLGMMGRYEEDIKERFLESAVDTVDIDGNLFGVPYTTESIALFYNKTLLEELHSQGIIPSAEPATDWNEIVALAKEFNNVQTNSWTIRWQVEEPYFNHMFLTAFGYKLFGSDGTNPDMIGFDTPEVLEGLHFFRSMRPYWDVFSGDCNWDVTTIAYARGGTPYLVSGPWSMEPVRIGAETNGFEFGVTTIPLIEGQQPYTFSGVNIICVSPYSKYPAAARALAMYMASEEMLTFTYEHRNMLPALNEKYAANIPGLKNNENIRAFMTQANFSHAMPSIPEMTYFWPTASNMFTSVWDGIRTPEEAARNALDEYNTLRRTGG